MSKKTIGLLWPIEDIPQSAMIASGTNAYGVFHITAKKALSRAIVFTS
jgi:hypothetical protein